MSGVMDFSDYLKGLPSATDLASGHVPVFDADGECRSVSSAILSLGYRERNQSGASLAAVGTSLVIAVDRAEPAKAMVYLSYRENGGTPLRTVIFANGLSLGAANNQGTMVVTGGTDVVQFAIGLGNPS